ncbi:MAG: hypothetical protein K2N46_09380 [Lachnospiraceae bacterium]|nr:hypothetical protein [Lachnospiraceae bacterium]
MAGEFRKIRDTKWKREYDNGRLVVTVRDMGDSWLLDDLCITVKSKLLFPEFQVIHNLEDMSQIHVVVNLSNTPFYWKKDQIGRLIDLLSQAREDLAAIEELLMQEFPGLGNRETP